MKKLFFCLLAFFSVCAYAQEDSEQVTSPELVVNTNPYKNYSCLYAGYSPLFISYDGYHKSGTKTVHGALVGWKYGVSLTRKCPLYLEFGLSLSMNRKGDTEEFTFTNDKGMNVEAGKVGESYTLVRFSVPFNLTYRFNVGKVTMAPYAGFTMHFNTLNEENSYAYYTNEYKKRATELGYLPVDYDEDVYWHHGIQAACQVGFNVTILKHMHIGVEYGLSLSNINDNVKSSRAVAIFGYEW